ncbi:MAG: phytanoyl-CoA dioxygenase [Sphaerospermopsis sp. SIO1G2]|nr:phytanoyl-CoA dioxygenase [Sphaerospermopsis sp. SIO1G1]NET72709.1 phytanoyl-CoA dioxygenase [Sphaerospermopsis sp. SIO1G2]
MAITKEQIEHYQETGLLLIPELFSQAEIAEIKAVVDDLSHKNTPGCILEKDNKTVRALHGCHQYSDTFKSLIRYPRLLTPACEMLGSDVYIYQLKINLKGAFNGDVWPWHQDYVFWDEEDGMPSPQAINIAIFLDEFNEFNGPVYFIPGSHKQSLTHLGQKESANTENVWESNVSAALKYSLDQETVTKLVNQQGIVAPKGPAGSVLFFHSNSVHGSAPNISPYPRRLLIITYNSINNIPRSTKAPRPEFLVSRDYTPLKPLREAALV